MDKKYTITAVSNNTEKYHSYAAYLHRFKQAKKSEFYLECLWILYAMLEDRTSSLLFHIGFTAGDKRNAVTHSKKIRVQIRNILGITSQKEKYRLNSLSGKLQRIQQVLLWSASENDSDTSYKVAIKKALRSLPEKDKLENALSFLTDEWRTKRNQLTHALFSKNSDAVIAELQPLVDDGFCAIRIIDSAVQKIKKTDIRGKFKIK